MITFIIGDIHGESNALMDIISKIIKYCRENEIKTKSIKIVFLGDYVDRGPQSCNVLDLLIAIKKVYNCIFLLGNHDSMWIDDCIRNDGKFTMYIQGAKETINSYAILNRSYLDSSHISFLQDCKEYYVDDNNNLFVHAGFNREYDIANINYNNKDTLIWDRLFIKRALSYESMRDKTHPFKSVNNFNWKFIGHTPVQEINKNTEKPIILQNAKTVLCDVGCGKFISHLYCVVLSNNQIQIL